jgi:hypothetical protein
MGPLLLLISISLLIYCCQSTAPILEMNLGALIFWRPCAYAHSAHASRTGLIESVMSSKEQTHSYDPLNSQFHIDLIEPRN